MPTEKGMSSMPGGFGTFPTVEPVVSVPVVDADGAAVFPAGPMDVTPLGSAAPFGAFTNSV